jgi:Secretion system C-terminal sorting domain/Pregnancy-associated plasma protein-A
LGILVSYFFKQTHLNKKALIMKNNFCNAHYAMHKNNKRIHYIFKKVFILFATLLLVGNINGQNNCAFDSYLNKNLKEDTSCLESYNIILNNLIQNNANTFNKINKFTSVVGGVAQNNIINSEQIVPVVFHLIGANSTALTDLQVTAALAKLNLDFANGNASQVPVSKDAKIKFCLAQNAPAGKSWNSTMNGINRYTNPTWNTISSHFLTDGPFLPYTWPAFGGIEKLKNYINFPDENYLDVYVVDQIHKVEGINFVEFLDSLDNNGNTITYSNPDYMSNVANIGGFASFPEYSIMTYNYGDVCVLSEQAISDANSHTFAHEVAHYLSLFHTFFGECQTNNSMEPCNYFGDRCCDTPPVGVIDAGIIGKNSCNETYFGGVDKNDMIENFMDYTDNAFKNCFSSDQVDRMKYTLSYYRHELISGLNLSATGVLSCAGNPLFSDFDIYPTGTKAYIENICVTEAVDLLTINNTSYTYTWSISPNTFTNNPTGNSPNNIVFNAPGTYTINLIVTNANNISNSTTKELIVNSCAPINNQNVNWFFGEKKCISFETGIAKLSPDSSLIQANQPCASYTFDIVNNRSVYTNGGGLWYRDNLGDVLISNQLYLYSYQNIPYTTGIKSTVIMPKPGNANILYLIVSNGYANINYGPDGIKFYEIDISTPTPTLVSTIASTPTINSPVKSSINVIPHENGTDYWLVAIPFWEQYPGQLIVYLINSSGIVNQNSTIFWGNYIPSHLEYSYLTVSPDRRIIARHGSNGTTLNFFDCGSGKSNFIKYLENDNNYWWGVFSSNSKYFYYDGDAGRLKQLDLSNLSYCNNQLPFEYFGDLMDFSNVAGQLGPDNRIYITGRNDVTYNNNAYLKVINKPNEKLITNANNIDYTSYGVCMGHNVSNRATKGLPNDMTCEVGNTVNDFRYQNCNCGLVSFIPLKAGVNFTWNFGDGIAITNKKNGPIPLCFDDGHTYNNYQYPCHIYQTAGTYTVTCTVDNNPPITKIVTITNAPPSAPDIIGNDEICFGDNTQSFTTAVANVNYNWQIDKIVLIDSTSQNITATLADTLPVCVRLTITNSLGCINANAHTVENTTLETNIMVANNAICSGSSTTLNASTNCNLIPVTYSWQGDDGTNYIGQSIVIAPTNTTTTYTVMATNGLQSATSTVIINTILVDVSVNANSSCYNLGDNINLQASALTSSVNDYLLLPLNISNSTGIFNNLTNGTYSIIATNVLGCTNQTTIIINAGPLVTGLALVDNICMGDNTTLNGAGALTYTWSYGVTDGLSFNPQATNIYTVTGIDGNNCTNTNTVIITVNPLPLVNATFTPSNICLGGSATASASGSASYNWSGGLSNGSVITPNSIGNSSYTITGIDALGCSQSTIVVLSVNPIPTLTISPSATCYLPNSNLALQANTNSTLGSFTIYPGALVSNTGLFTGVTNGNYTVQVTDANGCTNTGTIVINAAPTITAIASANNICLGGITTLTGAGATNYIWNNGVTNGSSFMPTTTTTYVVTGTDANNCTNTDQITVSVNPIPIITANIITQNNCLGQSAIVNATGGSSYIWSNNITNGVPFVPANIGNNIYTVTGISSYGCSNTASITINVSNAIPNFCCNPAFLACPNSQYLNNTLASSMANSFNNTCFFVNGIFTINQNMTFTNCSFYFTPNSKIQLTGSSIFFIATGCTFEAGCDAMWLGITSQPLNTITLTNCTLKDMIDGVYANNAIVMAKNSQFINNAISLQFTNTTDNYITKIENCNFETVGALKTPMLGAIGTNGIKTYNARNLNIGNTFGQGNTFKNLQNGINVFNNFKKWFLPSFVVNINYNKFENIKGGANVWDFPMWDNYVPGYKFIYQDQVGCAIYSDAGVKAQNGTININGNPSNAPQSTYINNFDNCNKAVVINATNCWIWNNKAIHTNAGFLFNKMDGKSAVASENVLGNNADDVNDGVMIGISKVGNDKTGMWGFHTDANDIKLKAMPLFNDDNMLQNKQISIGINSQYYSTNTGNTEAHNNRIAIPNDYNAVGIRLENATQSNYRYNKINFSNTNTPTISGLLAGIALQNTQNAVITNNAITGLNDPLFLNNHNSMGFYTSGSKGMLLNCNTADYLRFGIYNIENSSTGGYDRINSNRFTTRTSCILHRKLVNEGTLGDIGENLSTPPIRYNSDNIFGGTNSWQRVKRFTNCTVATTDKIVTTQARLVQSQSSTAPINLNCNVKVINPTSFTNTYTLCPLPVLQMVPTPPPTPPMLPYSTCDIGAMANSTPLDLQLARRIAGDSIDYIMMDAGGRWADERLLYQWLQAADESVRTDNPILDSFYLAMNNSNIKYITQFDDAIAMLSDSLVANDSVLYTTYLNAATTANNAINSELLFETNEKWVNTMYLNYLEYGTDEWPTEDVMRIETLANSCPYLAGNAVFKARALYAMFVPGLFFDNLEICNNAGVFRTKDSTDYQKEQALLNADIGIEKIQFNVNTSLVKIYPNPTRDYLNIEYNINKKSRAEIKIFDIYGKIIYSEILKSGESIATIKLANIIPGMYFCNFIENELTLFVGKFVVQ